jgi:hypothetical protein
MASVLIILNCWSEEWCLLGCYAVWLLYERWRTTVNIQRQVRAARGENISEKYRMNAHEQDEHLWRYVFPLNGHQANRQPARSWGGGQSQIYFCNIMCKMCAVITQNCNIDNSISISLNKNILESRWYLIKNSNITATSVWPNNIPTVDVRWLQNKAVHQLPRGKSWSVTASYRKSRHILFTYCAPYI